MWCFTLEDNNIGHSDTHEEFYHMYFPRYTAHVDALTGEIYLVNAETEKGYKKKATRRTAMTRSIGMCLLHKSESLQLWVSPICSFTP